VAVFTTIALCIAVAAVFMVGSVAGAPPSSDAPSSSVGTVVWLGGVVVLVAFFAEVAVEGWSALLIERDLGGLATQGAAGPALLGLTMGIGRLGGHVLTRFVAETRLIALACLASALGALGAFAATTPLLAQIGFAVMGLGIALVVPLALGLVGRSAAPARRVAAIARASAIGYAAFMFGPLLMGGVAEALSLAASYAVVAAILVAVAVFVVPAFARASAVDRGF
jgi:MFS family permease